MDLRDRHSALTEPLSLQLWEQRYRLAENGDAVEPDIEASWDRLARVLSGVEPYERDLWRRRFRDALTEFRFLPGGRILAHAGSHRKQTLLNCFVSGTVHDSVEGIFNALAEAMLTLQAGGGIGCDFSPMRPQGMPVAGSGAVASGPLSFLKLWDHACGVMASTRLRHGAMMALLRCDHPDIERFVDARRTGNGLHHFNLSVLVSDAFLDAVERGASWPLVFPVGDHPVPPGTGVCERALPGVAGLTTCTVHDVVDARTLWNRIGAAAWETGDPGVLFIDRIERQNNLGYAERIAAANPCGETPLPPHGACNLGSINLTAFVRDPFGPQAALDHDGIAATGAVATRMLDNVYEITLYPLRAQQQAARTSRRLGLGITGLADALAMLNLGYDTPEGCAAAAAAMRTVCHAAYRASVELAQERGSFPSLNPSRYLEAPFVAALPADLREQISRYGVHNSHLTAIAPAASISLLANNISCGIEPIQALQGQRTLPGLGQVPVCDHAYGVFRARLGPQAALPPALARATGVGVAAQLDMMAAVQPFVDQAVSKAVRLPPDCTAEEARPLFGDAYRLGLKGCSLYRASSARQAL